MNQQYYIYSRILQVLFQHAALNLITTKREFTVLQYSTSLSSVITSFCIIFDICYMMNLAFYIYSRILPVLISTCRIEFNHYKREFTLLTNSSILKQHAALNLIPKVLNLLSSIIASFCIIFDICYMMNQQYYIYSRILPVLICIEFNHYKTWIYSISVL